MSENGSWNFELIWRSQPKRIGDLTRPTIAFSMKFSQAKFAKLSCNSNLEINLINTMYFQSLISFINNHLVCHWHTHLSENCAFNCSTKVHQSFHSYFFTQNRGRYPKSTRGNWSWSRSLSPLIRNNLNFQLNCDCFYSSSKESRKKAKLKSGASAGIRGATRATRINPHALSLVRVSLVAWQPIGQSMQE